MIAKLTGDPTEFASAKEKKNQLATSQNDPTSDCGTFFLSLKQKYGYNSHYNKGEADQMLHSKHNGKRKGRLPGFLLVHGCDSGRLANYVESFQFSTIMQVMKGRSYAGIIEDKVRVFLV